jgi:hypothetical protein
MGIQMCGLQVPSALLQGLKGYGVGAKSSRSAGIWSCVVWCGVRRDSWQYELLHQCTTAPYCSFVGCRAVRSRLGLEAEMHLAVTPLQLAPLQQQAKRVPAAGVSACARVLLQRPYDAVNIAL